MDSNQAIQFIGSEQKNQQNHIENKRKVAQNNNLLRRRLSSKILGDFIQCVEYFLDDYPHEQLRNSELSYFEPVIFLLLIDEIDQISKIFDDELELEEYGWDLESQRIEKYFSIIFNSTNEISQIYTAMAVGLFDAEAALELIDYFKENEPDHHAKDYLETILVLAKSMIENNLEIIENVIKNRLR